MLRFFYDQMSTPRIGYPNLARHHARPFTSSWREFDNQWPRVVPLRLLHYLDWNNVDYDIVTKHHEFDHAWYPIGLGWFDHDLDYVSLIPPSTKDLISLGKLRVMFYYHEGDNVQRMIDRLNSLWSQHHLPADSYVLISANTQAELFDRSIYFADHECFFRWMNRTQQASNTVILRDKDFTVLNRTHKIWRAAIMADLHRCGVLNNSLWSYGLTSVLTDSDTDLENPLEMDQQSGWREHTQEFLSGAPYACDSWNTAQHNDHHGVNEELYRRSAISVIIETHFDADQSRGAFFTEKTFKAIKYAQPFVMVGPAGSLAALKKSGYRTFDHVIDPSYDAIQDNTARWFAVRDLLQNLCARGTAHVAQLCHADVQHNQQLFCSRRYSQVNNLVNQLCNH